MTERPILFSAPMVRAILDGTKTQTRRVAKPVRGFEHNNILKYGMPHSADPCAVWWHSAETDRVGCQQECPYGVPGDRLWVRETWRTGKDLDSWGAQKIAGQCLEAGYQKPWAPIQFAADSHEVNGIEVGDFGGWGKLRPSIFMPRWACRIELEVTDVRVQRVQDISSADAQAEGMESCTPYDQYRALWDHLNAKRGFGWGVNPWVWCVSFRRIA